MLNIVDKPSLQYIVEELVESGITEIVIVTGRNKTYWRSFWLFIRNGRNLKKFKKTELLDKISHISTMANIY